MGVITTDPARFGDEDNTLLLKAATALQAVEDTLGSAVLYTSQSLTAAQAGQVYTNLSPSGGAAGIQKFKADDSAGYGSQWFNGATQIAGLWADVSNQKLHIDFRKQVSLTPIDPTVNGAYVQLNARNGTAGTDVTFVGAQGTASGSATTINSQYFELCSEYWTGAARVTTGVLCRSVSLDTSGNVAMQFTKSTLSPDNTNAAVVQAEFGTAAIVAYGFVGDSDMGMWKDTTSLMIQSSNQGNRLELTSSYLNCLADLRLFVGSFGTQAAAALALHYANTGFFVDSNNDFRATVNNTTCVSFLNTGFKIASGLDLTLGNTAAAGTITADKTIIIKDATGTSYKIPVVAA